MREYLLLAAAFAGLGVSALLFAEYRQPVPALCGPGGGCEVVRNSAYSHILGIPLPDLGVVYFTAVAIVLIAPPLRRWLLPLGAIGAVAGLGFIGVQAFVLSAFCRLCLVVDVAALLIGGLALSLRGRNVEQPSRGFMAAQILATLIALVGPMLWHTTYAMSSGSSVASGEVPAIVKREQKPDRVTVVEFVDFKCPACRAQHEQFESVLANYQDRVNVVFKHMPLPNHENAADAARAFCCAEERGVARQMADKLFTAESLAPEDCEQIAASVGLDLYEFRNCVQSDRVAERLREDQNDALAIGIRGLPTFWIGEERFEGVHESEVLRSSIERALDRSSQS